MARSLKAQQVNSDVLSRMNRQVSLQAAKFANTLLSSIFCSIFRIEKAYEFARPETFLLEHDPERIIWSRLDDFHLSNLAISIVNEDVTARQYELFTEYDFVLVADTSRSMLVNCWDIYGGRSYFSESKDTVEDLERLRRTKIYMMKYTITSFLHAARKNNFATWVSLFGGNSITEFNSKDNYNLEEVVLSRIDEHFVRLVEGGQTERPMLAEVLQQLATRKRRCIILCISDFMDCVEFVNKNKVFGEKRSATSRLGYQNVLVPFGEIARHNRILALFVNDRAELKHYETKIKVYGQEAIPEDVEIRSREEIINVRRDNANRVVDNIKKCRKFLTANFRKLGVMYGDLVAGQDDDELEKRIYKLGTISER